MFSILSLPPALSSSGGTIAAFSVFFAGQICSSIVYFCGGSPSLSPVCSCLLFYFFFCELHKPRAGHHSRCLSSAEWKRRITPLELLATRFLIQPRVSSTFFASLLNSAYPPGCPGPSLKRWIPAVWPPACSSAIFLRYRIFHVPLPC